MPHIWSDGPLFPPGVIPNDAAPQTNGKAERFIQTCLRGWAYKRPYPTLAYRGAALPAFPGSCNTQREHSALGQVPPLFHYLMRREQPHEI